MNRSGPADRLPAALRAEVEAWIKADPDPRTRAELAGLVAAGDLTSLQDRFGNPLGFGTAGLRGQLGAGPGRMNRLVVRRTTAGVANWVLAKGADAARRGIVVGHDARHGSGQFATDVAEVASSAGVRVHMIPSALPTPITAFAVKHLGAAAGVMITASHNPAADNGYKVYAGDGAQVIAPDDAEIAAAAERPGAAPTGDAGAAVETVDEQHLIDAYRRGALGLLRPGSPRRLRVVYTAMHGVGGAVTPGLLEDAGFGPLSLVAEQADPDPDFPTVPFPNPEEPGALDLALELALRSDADVVIANDPDADRLAIAVPDPVSGAWRRLTGDELGALLAGHVLAATAGDDRLVATTIVSSSLLSKMAAAAGVFYAETLTGFKWIARAAQHRPGTRLVFGYEEAIGYEVGDLVSDKDGISAALVAAEVVAGAKARGSSVAALLDDLAVRFGVHATSQWSLRLSGADAAAEMARIVAGWRTGAPGAIAGLEVTEVVDLAGGSAELPPTDAIVMRLGGRARVVLRPSGTEPKLKAYLEVVSEPPSPARLAAERRQAAALLAEMERDVAATCQAIRTSVG